MDFIYALIGFAVLGLIPGAMFGGFSSYSSEKDKEKLWRLIIIAVFVLAFITTISGNNNDGNTIPACDVSDPMCNDGSNPDIPEP